MKFNLKLTLGLQEKENPYSTEAGNGTKIKKYFYNKNEQKHELETKNIGSKAHPIIVPDYDNLYEKIQLQTGSTDYKKIINKNSNIEDIKMIFEQKHPFDEKYMDTTIVGDTEKMKETENQINAKFGSQQNFQNFANEKIKNYQNQINEYIKFINKQKEISKTKALLKEMGESGKKWENNK